MSSRTTVMWGVVIGSVVGGYIPTLWGAGFFSYWSILTSTVGALIGLYLAYKLTS